MSTPELFSPNYSIGWLSIRTEASA